CRVRHRQRRAGRARDPPRRAAVARSRGSDRQGVHQPARGARPARASRRGAVRRGARRARPARRSDRVTRSALDISQLVAFDVHVHLEHQGELTETDKVAERYFKSAGVPRDWPSQGEYYRSRKIGCVVFTVDESLTGRPHAANDEIARFAADNRDIAIAFASINPARGRAGVEEARRLVSSGAVRGLKLHPPVQEFFPNDRAVYPLYEVFADAKLPILF